MFLFCFNGYLYLMGLWMQFIVISLQPYCVKFILTSHKNLFNGQYWYLSSMETKKTVLQEIIQRKSWWFQIVGSTKVLIQLL